MRHLLSSRAVSFRTILCAVNAYITTHVLYVHCHSRPRPRKMMFKGEGGGGGRSNLLDQCPDTGRSDSFSPWFYLARTVGAVSL